MAVKKKILLKVLFDTNVIYTGSASDLLKKEISDLINNHSTLSDIEIEWLLPEIVLKERIFQMTKKGGELLPSISKLEKLLGHNLNINSEIISFRINESIKAQLNNYKLKTIVTDIKKIDWESLIHNAVNRIPPFEDSEKEKGFRDALILENFKQIISESPSSKSICRIIFITNDNLVNESAKLLISEKKNVNVFNKPDELISLINILNSEITEELINSISDQARAMFFTKDDKTTLYYTEEIQKKIRADYSKEVNIKHENSDFREDLTFLIDEPGFERKEKQRVFWKTPIEISFESYKNSRNSGASSLSTLPTKSLTNLIQTTSGLSREKVGEGATRFEVIWSVTLTTTKKLKTPKIESIKYIDTVF